MSGPDRLVYSTDDPTPRQSRRDGRRAHRRAADAPAANQPGVRGDTVYVERSRKGRGGKTVTLVVNLPGTDADRKDILARLKTGCGAGGTLKDGIVEIQGDHRDRIVEALRASGHTVKARGG